MNTIAEATKDCPRQDCSLQERGGVSTCVAWRPTYDKQGNRTDRGDPNTHSSSLHCSTCGKDWHVSTRFGETTVSRCGSVA